MTHGPTSFTSLQLRLVALCLLLAVVAHAGTPTPLSQVLTGEAKAAYESGRLLFEDGDSHGAFAKFSQSYDLSSEPRLLWNMAACEKELRHYARAAMLIGRYLREGEAKITAEQRQAALETQRALAAFYAAVRLKGVPAGATILVDGGPRGRAPLAEPLLVDLGSRVLRVQQTGFEPFEQRLEVAGGEELEIAVGLRRSAGTAAPARLSITSSGTRDVIVIDGRVVGTQHWDGQVAVGEHRVRVTAPGKRPYEAHVQLAAGNSRSLQIALEAEASSKAIWYWIAGGTVVIAGTALGGYFLLKPDEPQARYPEGRLATVHLPLGGAP